MNDHDIFKADNRLLMFGYPVFIISILVLTSMVSRLPLSGDPYGYLQSLPVVPVFFTIGSFILILIGHRIRSREKMINAILRNLMRVSEIRAGELMAGTGFTRRQISDAVLTVNRTGLGYYLWDTASDTITDGRLRRKMVYVDRCGSCGHALGNSYPIHLETVPDCPYCDSPLDLNEWNELKMKAFNEIRDHDITDAVNAPGTKQFSIGLFIFLFFFFWPAAVIYVVTRYNGPGNLLDEIKNRFNGMTGRMKKIFPYN